MKKTIIAVATGVIIGAGGVVAVNQVQKDEKPVVEKSVNEQQETTIISKENTERTKDIGVKKPWEVYSTDEIYERVNSNETVFLQEDSEALESAFFTKYKEGTLDKEWGKYLHVFGAELQPKYPEDKEYFEMIIDAGVYIMNGAYDDAKFKMDVAKSLREAQ